MFKHWLNSQNKKGSGLIENKRWLTTEQFSPQNRGDGVGFSKAEGLMVSVSLNIIITFKIRFTVYSLVQSMHCLKKQFAIE